MNRTWMIAVPALLTAVALQLGCGGQDTASGAGGNDQTASASTTVGSASGGNGAGTGGANAGGAAAGGMGAGGLGAAGMGSGGGASPVMAADDFEGATLSSNWQVIFPPPPPGQPGFGNWAFKYDGVPSAQTRVMAEAPATNVTPPAPGDTLRIEVSGYQLRGYKNGILVMTASDTDASKIAGGRVGLAARWASGNMSTQADAKVWESWAGGSL